MSEAWMMDRGKAARIHRVTRPAPHPKSRIVSGAGTWANPMACNMQFNADAPHEK
jgi:hypothetical protein